MSTTDAGDDRLYELIPAVYRMRDADQGYPLRALLQVIAEQVTLVEEDIGRLYENWFIETCEDWVVPYIGALIGYQPVESAGRPGGGDAAGQARNRILVPRQEVADTLRHRRRKEHVQPDRRACGHGLRLAGPGARVLPAARGQPERQPPAPQPRPHRRSARQRRARLHRRAVRPDGAQRRRPAGQLRHATGRRQHPRSRCLRLAAALLSRDPDAGLLLRGGIAELLPVQPTRQRHRALRQAGPGRAAAAPDLRVPAPIRRRNFDARETQGRLVSGVPFFYGDGRSPRIWAGLAGQSRSRPAHRSRQSQRLALSPDRRRGRGRPRARADHVRPGQGAEAGGLGLLLHRLQRRYGRRRIRPPAPPAGRCRPLPRRPAAGHRRPRARIRADWRGAWRNGSRTPRATP